MHKIFIDCGFYRGGVLRTYLDQGTVDQSWTIYAFEPNPDLETQRLIADFFPDVSINLIDKAVWTKSTKKTFLISGREDAASLAGTSGHTAPKEVTVATVDFSKFVDSLPQDAYIICSFDAEGAEYTVLPKMLADGTIDRLNELDIEFHHRLMPDYDQNDSQDLIDEILRHGIKLRLKVPLN